MSMSKQTNEGTMRTNRATCTELMIKAVEQQLYLQTAPVAAADEWCDGCTCAQHLACQRKRPIPSSHAPHKHTCAHPVSHLGVVHT